MNIETKWLEDLLALAATRSFSQAAERRHVTQPAFSRRIRSLENTLGLTLVNRARTPVELTEAGQLFLVTARNMVEQMGEVVHYLHNLEGQRGEVLQIAAAHSLALGFFPAWAVHALREGTCDLILAYYDPDAALQMDPELFPSLSLGRTEMVPVCAVDAGGQPLFDPDSGQSVPLLAYSAGASLGRSVNALLRQRALRSTTVYETAMADSLKSMAMQKLGLAWVPRLSVTAELARGELVVCGGEHWRVPLEIRLHRCALVRKAPVRLLWRKLEAGAGQGVQPPVDR